MLTIAKLFGKSPFAPLQTHMQKVKDCIDMLPSLFSQIEKGNMEEICKISKIISKLEHEADQTKNDIRNHLPKSLFLPIDRSHLLEILSLQDSLADKAEDIAIQLTFSPLTHYEQLSELFSSFYKKNIEAFYLAFDVIKEIDPLLESSFGGMEAEKVRGMVEKIAFKEHEADLLQYALLKELYARGKEFTHVDFFLWVSVLKDVAAISNLSEKLGNRIRMLLELK